ncbi:MAG: integral rane sensor signal transduction histidine kinase [Firmicutes bacterium]|nr:integral rane sensor signal transduction histidine kinase [Bacillota bacterium]
MTIKERLYISNTLMIIVPVVITAIIAVACLEIVWLTMINGTGLVLKDAPPFYNASQKIAAITETFLNTTDPNEQAKQIKLLEKLLDQSSLSLIISTSDAERYHFGKEIALNDPQLLAAMAALNNEGIVTSNGHNYYAHQTEISGTLYRISILGQQLEDSPHLRHKVLILCGIILIFGIFLSVLFTNKFLIKFVFQKIERPLNILTNGVRQIRDGNLEYSIKYDRKDEFAPVCEDFNDMAVRLKKSVALLQQQEVSRKELLAGISHDLRSPLTAIRAYVEGLLEGVARTPEAQRNYLETIKTKAIDIDQMVAKIFLFSKMEIGENWDHPEVLNLAAEIKTLINAVGREYKEKGLEITVKNLLSVAVLADPNSFRRILVNILDNSLKYKNKAVGIFTISLHQENAYVILTLSDDGPGVPEESLSRIFDPFYRSDPARQNPHKGSGLGLAIVFKIVSQLDGRIVAKNRKNGGLTIEIKLPLQEAKV